jgi:CHAT domain-containing protein/tetratricopeptide (TPR) repeat protein
MREALFPKAQFPHGHPDLAESLNNLGALLFEQGEFGQAERFYRRALAMRQALYPGDRFPSGHPLLAASLNGLGRLLQEQGKYAQAEPLHRQALGMYRALFPRDKFPQGPPELAQTLGNLGALLRLKGDYAGAEPFYRQALAMRQALHPNARYPRGHPYLATCLNNLGVFLQARGDYAQAETVSRRAVEMCRALYPPEKYPDGHPDLATSLNTLGAVLQAQGNYAQAEPLVRRALQIFTQQVSRLARTAPEAVALNAAAAFPFTRDALLSITRPLPDSAARTYEAVWHSKAGITRVYQRRHLALMAAATDASVRGDWDNLQRLRRRREELLMAPAPRGGPARDGQLRQLHQQIEEEEQKLLSRLPALRHSEDLARLGPDALRQRFANDAALVDFLRYVDFESDPARPGSAGEKRTARYLAFVVTREDVRRVELGPAPAVEGAVRDFRDAITTRPPGGHEAGSAGPGERLRRLVWEPVRRQLPAAARTVYLAPDAALTRLPWAALPGGGKDTVLLDDCAVAVVPHGPFLLEQLTPPPPRSPRRPAAPEGVLLVGGIGYDEPPSSTPAAGRVVRGAGEPKVTWPDLPGTEEERRLLERLLEKTGPKLTASLGGRDAAAERLRRELERARYAHLGTHGFFADARFRSVLQLDEQLFARSEARIGDSLFIGQRIGEGARSPLVLSGLVCAGANLPETPERGILSADAIAGLLLDDLHLAVLSACDTGLGDVAGGEGVHGLQRAFHLAGCRNVVASLWQVDDEATAALMAKFYHGLWVAKRPPIEALREAQLTVYRHPQRIAALARERGPAFTKAVQLPAAAAPPGEPAAAPRAPTKLWAAFVLSGVGQ